MPSYEQLQVGRFTDFIGATHTSQLRKFQEEVTEAILEEDKTSKAFGMELTDVIIVSLGLIHCLGLDFEQLFDEKMRINFEKYEGIRTLKEQGIPHHEAQDIIKERWAGK